MARISNSRANQLNVASRRAGSQGVTLVSLLVTLSLIGLSLSCILPSVHSLIQSIIVIRREAAAQRLAARLSIVASHLMQDADTHRLPLALRVHTNGHITFQSGKPHPILRSSPTQRPIASDAISVLALDSASILTARTTTPIREEDTWFEGCVVRGSPPPTAPYRSFLAISADGPAEVVARSFVCDGGGCCRGNLRQEESLTVPPTTQGRPLLVIPILRQVTYYVSNQRELRLFQQVGSTMIENQPLYAGVPPLSMTLSWEPTPGISITSRESTEPLTRYPIRHYGSLTRASFDYFFMIDDH